MLKACVHSASLGAWEDWFSWPDSYVIVKRCSGGVCYEQCRSSTISNGRTPKVSALLL